MANVSRSLTALTYVIWPLAFLIAASPFVFFWLPPDFAFAKHDLLNDYGGVEHLLIWQKILGFFVTYLPAAFLLWALSYLYRLVGALKSGEWFEEYSEILCHRFGRTLLWYVGVEIVHRTLLVLVLTGANPPGQKQLYLSFSNNDLMALVPAILALIFAHIVSLGRAQREELKQII